MFACLLSLKWEKWQNSDKKWKLVTSTSSAWYVIVWVVRSHTRARTRKETRVQWSLMNVHFHPRNRQIKLLPKTRNVSDPFQFPSSAKCTSYANFLAISPFLPPLEVWSLYSAGHGIWTGPKKRHQRQRIHDWHWRFLINSMFRTSVHDRFELPRVKLQQMYWGNPGKIDFGSSYRELTMTLSNYLFPTFFCLNSMASFNISSRE